MNTSVSLPVHRQAMLQTMAIAAALFVCFFAIIVSRRADIILHAQPWAEDGTVWLSQAYNEGIWRSLFRPQDGYFQTISRIAYGTGLIFGLENAPAIATSIAIAVRCAFLIFALSRRFEFIPISLRVCAVIYFLLMPNVAEGYVNVTNAHWYLAIYLMAVMLASNPPTRFWRLHDLVVLVLAGLSGPFVVFLSAALLIKRWHEHGSIPAIIRNLTAFDIVMAACFVLQVAAILSTAGGRSPAPLGASVSTFADIISSKIIFGAILPGDVARWLTTLPVLMLGAAMLFAGSIVYFFYRGSWRLRSTMVFVLLLFGFALARPMVNLVEPQWPLLALENVGDRYFIITNFGAFCFLLYAIYQTTKSTWVATAVTGLAVPFLMMSYLVPALPESDYRQDIAVFQTLPQNETMNVRINPPGWSMSLTKR